MPLLTASVVGRGREGSEEEERKRKTGKVRVVCFPLNARLVHELIVYWHSLYPQNQRRGGKEARKLPLLLVDPRQLRERVGRLCRRSLHRRRENGDLHLVSVYFILGHTAFQYPTLFAAANVLYANPITTHD